MIQKSLSLLLAVLLIDVLSPVHASAKIREEKKDRHAEKVRDAIARLGVGEGAYVKIKLRDKRDLSGYVSQVGVDCFIITEARMKTTVAYRDVIAVNGDNFSSDHENADRNPILSAARFLYYLVKLPRVDF